MSEERDRADGGATQWTPPGATGPTTWGPPPDRPPTPTGAPPVGPAGAQGPPPPPTGPGGGDRSRLVVGLAVALLVVLAVALVGLVVATRDSDEAPVAGERPEQPAVPGDPGGDDPAGSPADDELAAVVAELSRFVEQQRQLEFLEPVEVELLDDDVFTERLFEDALDDRESLEETEAVLRALRLIGDDVDLFDTLIDFLGAGVLGFYDTESAELVVRGTELTPYVRSVLVHELTHALDDQHFELHRPELDDLDDESSYAFSALVEGNAVRVEQAYLASLSAEERREAAAEEQRFGAGIDFSGVPEIVQALITFPYAVGPQLVDVLVQQGGERRVDAAFADPPTTTRHVLDPETYLDFRAPRPVDPPPADGEVFDEGAIGQWVLVLILADELGPTDAMAAARGWAGDWYVAWAEADRTCIRAAFVMDNADDLAGLADALERWAGGHGNARVEATDGEAVFTACG
jgi:hypothetical protein